MGLDMYLTGRRRVYRYLDDDCYTAINQNPVLLAMAHGRPVQGLEMEVHYWRKANAVHQWFVDNVQGGEDNCQPYPVQPDDLRALMRDCRLVLDDQRLAGEILPPAAGFFFGSTEINEWYWQDIEETWRVLDEVLKWPDIDRFTFTYQSSW